MKKGKFFMKKGKTFLKKGYFFGKKGSWSGEPGGVCAVSFSCRKRGFSGPEFGAGIREGLGRGDKSPILPGLGSKG